MPAFEDFFPARQQLVSDDAVNITLTPTNVFLVVGQFCADCPGCEWNGFKDEFAPSPINCHTCGHLVCPKASGRDP